MHKNILIVDDEYGIRMLLSEILRHEGYKIMVAKTGKEALEIIETTTVDLMIIDYNVPLMDGIKVIQQLQEQTIRIPSILISGMVESVMEKVHELHLVKEVLSKPFNVHELCEKVNSIVNHGT